MQDENLDQAAQGLGAAITRCLDEGFEFPIFAAFVAANGSCVVQRYDKKQDRGTRLTHHAEGAGFKLPINIMLSDGRGEARRIVVDRNNETRYMN